MGDIDRISKLAPGRFLTGSDQPLRVARKQDDPNPSKQHKEDAPEHADQVEIHINPGEESPISPPKSPKNRPQSQQNHLDISA